MKAVVIVAMAQETQTVVPIDQFLVSPYEHSIPPGWTLVRLGEVAEFANGFAFKPEHWSSKGRPIIRIQNLTNTSDKINFFDGELDQRYLVKNGDLLVSWSASLGAFIWNQGEAWLNQHIFKVGQVTTTVDKLYLYYALQMIIGELQRKSRGSTMKHVTRQEFLVTPIIVPPCHEQWRIAKVLSTIQRAIEAQEKVIVAARELKRSLMKHLFTYGPVLLTEISRVALKETDIGPIPEHWALVPCGDVCEAITVGVVVRPASHYVERGVPAFRSLNIHEDSLSIDDLVYFSNAANEGPLSKSKLRVGDVLIVRTGEPGTSCVVTKEFAGANCIDLVIVRPKREVVVSEYLSRFFNSVAGRRQALSARVGLAQQHLNVGAVRRTLVPIPAISTQRQISADLAAVDEKVSAEERRKAALQALFKTMLHHLMSGRIRVPETAMGPR
jgi:type I restriction enzyme S subunit